MVSDQEIASCVESVLRGAGAGPGDASLAAVLREAEAKLGMDLSHKAPFIQDQMDLFFGPRLQPPPPKAPAQAPPPPAPAPPAPQQQPQAQAQVLVQALPPTQQQQMQQPQPQQLAALQPQLIFQAMSQIPAVVPAATVPAVSSQPNMPMAFYPPPPLALRYASGLGGVATGGTVSFQQPNPGAVGGAASPTAPAAQAAGDNKESASKRKRGGPGGLNKVCAISPELQTIVGETALSRTQIVKQLWAYIRQNNLQDPDDKRKIICNDELRVVFGTDTTDMFKMNKLLAKHITPLDQKDQIREVKRLKPPTVAPKPGPPINQPSVVITDALAKFIGIEEPVPQDDALKYLWDYIKANQLEDVINGSIICDSKLQELFGCESIPMSGLSEMLAHHFISFASKRKRGGPGGLNEVCAISPELQTIVGETAMSRTQIVKQLWAYIRQNNLQDPDDKRKIICNDELRVVFGTDTTDMFKMNKLLAKHITPLDQTMVYDFCVEPHCPDRVIRQFGYMQPFPVAFPSTLDRVSRHDHRLSRAGQAYDDTRVAMLQLWVDDWDEADAEDHCAQPLGPHTEASYRDYLRWYQLRTPCRITYPDTQPQPHQPTTQDTYARHRDQALARAMQQCRVIELDAAAQQLRAESGFALSLGETAAAWRRTREMARSMLQAFGSYVPENEVSSGSSQASTSFPCHSSTRAPHLGQHVPQWAGTRTGPSPPYYRSTEEPMRWGHMPPPPMQATASYAAFESSTDTDPSTSAGLGMPRGFVLGTMQRDDVTSFDELYGTPAPEPQDPGFEDLGPFNVPGSSHFPRAGAPESQDPGFTTRSPFRLPPRDRREPVCHTYSVGHVRAQQRPRRTRCGRGG